MNDKKKYPKEVKNNTLPTCLRFSPNVVSYIAPRFIVSAAETGKAHATPPVANFGILLRRMLG